MPKKHNLTDEKWSPPSMIEWETFGRVGDDSAGEAFTKTQDVPTTTRIDDTGTYIYLGYAVPGTAEGTDAWRIARIDTSGNKLWADGNSLFDNVWTNRLTLNYV